MNIRSLVLIPTLAVFALNPASAVTFNNFTPIAIPGVGGTTSGPAIPFPSNIAVAGVGTTFTSLTVSLFNLSHTFPDDIDILLVGPTGLTLLLMSDVGGGTDIANVNLTFALGSPALPDGTQIVSGTFAPTNFEAGDTFVAPAPAGPYGSLLESFLGTNANGTWSLYVVDDTLGDSGQIAGGWSLTFNTPAGVADSGSAFLLFGLALGGIVAGRRRILPA